MDTTIITLDVETTGKDRAADQIIELAVQYGFATADHRPPRTVWRFKPTKPVGDSAKIHGITDEALAAEQPFRVHAQRIGEVIDEAEILIGYNIQFDIDFLCAEFARARVIFPSLANKRVIDGLRLWQSQEPRTLTAAHRRFVGGDFADAHSAGADVAATANVVLGMIGQFNLGDRTWDEIARISDPDRLTWLGHSNHVCWRNETPVVNFGKHAGKPLLDPEIRGYLSWMLKQDFPAHVREIVQAAVKLQDRFVAWARTKYPPPAAPPEPDPEATP